MSPCLRYEPADTVGVEPAEVAVSYEAPAMRVGHQAQRPESGDGQGTRRFGVGTQLFVIGSQQLISGFHPRHHPPSGSGTLRSIQRLTAVSYATRESLSGLRT